MFIRFVVSSRRQDSHRLTGIFHAACRLRDDGRLTEDEQQQYDGLLNWFNCYLPIPGRFVRSRKGDACAIAICWFKDGAARYIRRVRELAAMLERHGISVEMLWTGRPGYIVYEDHYQVVAIPFRNTRV